MIADRTRKVETGELTREDVTMKGACALLDRLSAMGIELYLASGTDQEDVEKEAVLLGYADLFNGGIYGAVGDVSKYSKKMVIEKIMADNHLRGHELAFFGDGPVEIRECRKRDGIAVGRKGRCLRCRGGFHRRRCPWQGMHEGSLGHRL